MNGKKFNANMNSRVSECGNSSKEYECERPFKKAKYMWQLKGKYYLKNEYKRAEQKVTPKTYESDNVDVNISRPNNSKSGYCNSVQTCNYIPTSRSGTRKPIDEIPLSMVKNINDDEYLHKWQTKRIAQSFIDNTINMILENWKISPFDACDLVENCANGGQIEDEGILMAIQSHGLQSTNDSTSRIPNVKEDIIQCQDSCSAISPTQIERSLNQNLEVNRSQIYQSTMDNYTNTQNETNQQKSAIDLNNVNSVPNEENEFKTDDSLDFLRTAVSVAIEKKGLSYTY